MENETQASQNIISPVINPQVKPKSKKGIVVIVTLILLVLAVAVALFAEYRKNKGISEEEKALIINDLTQKDEPISDAQREEMMNKILNSNQ